MYQGECELEGGVSMKDSSRLLSAALLALTLPWMGAAELSAQSGGPGFLFRTPTVSLGLRSGYSVPRAASEVFDFTREQLTVETSDFRSAYWGGELGIRVAPRVDVVLSVGSMRSTTPSEFRDWVDTDDLPIEQETRFTTTPVSLAAKYFLADRGRSVGRFAWIPQRMSPYVGGGVGLVWHSFVQQGDFVDFETFDIFTSTIRSDGVATQVHGMAGLDVSLNKSLYLTGEARYGWAKGRLENSFFEDFDDMDLAGVQLTFGVSVRF